MFFFNKMVDAAGFYLGVSTVGIRKRKRIVTDATSSRKFGQEFWRTGNF